MNAIMTDASSQKMIAFGSGQDDGGYEVDKRNLADVLLELLLVPGRSEETIDVLLEIDLSKDDYKNARDEFSLTNGCHNIVKAMHQSYDSPSMQWKCCKLIMSLTRNFPKNKNAFLRTHAVEAIVSSMKTFPNDAEVQLYGCGAIRHLSTESPEKIIDEGGLQAILDAMTWHPTYDELQCSGCMCLYSLACTDKGQFIDSIIEKGGGGRLADAHYLFKGKHSKVEEYSIKTLKILYCGGAVEDFTLTTSFNMLYCGGGSSGQIRKPED